MRKVFIEYSRGGYDDVQKLKVDIDELKRSVQLTACMNPGYEDYIRCEPISRDDIKLQPYGVLAINRRDKIVFECSGITELFPQTVQNPDGTETVEWLPKNDGPTIRELIEQRKRQQQ